ncbi:MAG TPA: creatininase family protein [Candidatus Saccharimonadales bacterium]|nr:creatininase family protein [Candidatus Saccharimonadales bacterium]
MLLEDCSWPEVQRLKPSKKIVLLPLGSFEQHGFHLPLTTDSDIVTAIARRVERARPGQILCLPTLWVGHSPHHLFFPGTLSVSQLPYLQLVLELCRSIVSMGAQKIFLLNGHGGNDVPLRAVVRELKTESPKVCAVFASYWSLANLRIQHACEIETSIMLHLSPGRVKMSLAKKDGDVSRMSARPAFYINEFHEISKTGTVGDPTQATAKKGKLLMDKITAEVTAFTDELAKW